MDRATEKEIRAIRQALEDEGYHYPNEILDRLSALVGDEWVDGEWAKP